MDENDETYVPAGNMLGKDFVAGFIVLRFFLTRQPCRVVTTSPKDDHLRVLWGEINHFISTCRTPLVAHQGGPLIVNHQEIRKVLAVKEQGDKYKDLERCPLSYIKGMVASPDTIAAMQGHHVANQGDGVPRTLAVIDEASSVPDDYMKMIRTWANRILVIGNTWPCDNFFKYAIKGKPGTEDKGGDIPRMAPVGPRVSQGTEGEAEGRYGYHRKIIRIRAVDSPNVRLALAEQLMGREPTGRVVVPGVKSWQEYQKNLATWDKAQQTVSLDAEFYEGAEVMLFPREWLELAGRRELWDLCRSHPAEAIGIDPGEGGANTSMAAVNRYGLKELVSKKTPDTSVVTREAVAFGQRHGVPANKWVFDRGGGGKQHADRLREMGYPVRTVAFGESIGPDVRQQLNREPFPARLEQREDHYAYRNRRAEMYGELRILIDPAFGPAHFGYAGVGGFAIPDAPGTYAELRRQLSPIPLCYDPEGRLELPPKNRRPGQEKVGRTTLSELLGCSPDEADATVLAIHGMLHKATRARAGVI